MSRDADIVRELVRDQDRMAAYYEEQLETAAKIIALLTSGKNQTISRSLWDLAEPAHVEFTEDADGNKVVLIERRA